MEEAEEAMNQQRTTGDSSPHSSQRGVGSSSSSSSSPSPYDDNGLPAVSPTPVPAYSALLLNTHEGGASTSTSGSSSTSPSVIDTSTSSPNKNKMQTSRATATTTATPVSPTTTRRNHFRQAEIERVAGQFPNGKFHYECRQSLGEGHGLELVMEEPSWNSSPHHGLGPGPKSVRSHVGGDLLVLDDQEHRQRLVPPREREQIMSPPSTILTVLADTVHVSGPPPLEIPPTSHSSSSNDSNSNSTWTATSHLRKRSLCEVHPPREAIVIDS